ncbi:MAG: PadR family transcriptional regulator [Leptospirales bacterium]|nr:PadR family transcriptional regulator [Leptospirales bacterium]
MSTIELIILGYLLDSPMSAYDINKVIEKKETWRLLKISRPAIFKTCKRLHQDGYLRSKLTRQGENPEKTIYAVSSSGKQHFLALMQHYAQTMQPYFLDCNAFIFHLGKLPKKTALQHLKQLRDQILQANSWMDTHIKESVEAPFPERMIVKQYAMTLRALKEWISYVIEEFSGS